MLRMRSPYDIHFIYGGLSFVTTTSLFDLQEIPLKMLKLSSQSQTRDLSHARGGAGEEVVKIRVKDLKAIKSRLLVTVFVSEM